MEIGERVVSDHSRSTLHRDGRRVVGSSGEGLIVEAAPDPDAYASAGRRGGLGCVDCSPD